MAEEGDLVLIADMPAMDTETMKTCPACQEKLPEIISTRLEHLLKLYIWYKNGHAPKKSRTDEHTRLLCAVHRFDTDEPTKLGSELNWPITVDEDWIRDTVSKLTDHCDTLVAHAPANELFIEVKEVLEDGEDLSEPSLDDYFNSLGFIRSAGYFGEQGFLVIHEMMQELYPPNTPTPQSIKPMNMPQFLRLVLVPEITCSLIAGKGVMPDESSIIHMKHEEFDDDIRAVEDYPVVTTPNGGEVIIIDD
ncbi:hypothetical protein JB92DRAFT_3105187 [Gautieria morchelliformis]|nr:hypothetical protein JB92DRAFT_3105187 [Gautieria morchelliformis]